MTPAEILRRGDFSSPLISKGKKELILCGDCGSLRKITRLNKDKSAQNATFDQIRRGDIIKWPPKNRVEKGDRLEIIKKALSLRE